MVTLQYTIFVPAVIGDPKTTINLFYSMHITIVSDALVLHTPSCRLKLAAAESIEVVDISSSPSQRSRGSPLVTAAYPTSSYLIHHHDVNYCALFLSVPTLFLAQRICLFNLR